MLILQELVESIISNLHCVFRINDEHIDLVKLESEAKIGEEKGAMVKTSRAQPGRPESVGLEDVRTEEDVRTS